MYRRAPPVSVAHLRPLDSPAFQKLQQNAAIELVEQSHAKSSPIVTEVADSASFCNQISTHALPMAHTSNSSSDHLLDCDTKPSPASVRNALPIPLSPPLPPPLSSRDPMPDFALEAPEKPFCEVGDEKNPASLNHPPLYCSPSSESSEGHQSQIIHYISTTTESMFMISLIERLKKIMGSWMWGQLLGSGSFGTMYEGISDDRNDELNALGHPHHKVLHPSSNSCIFGHHQDPWTLSPCEQCDPWNYTPQKFLEVVGTYYCMKAVGASLPSKLLEELKKIHEFYLQSPFCANKVLEMYSKYRSMKDARWTFDGIPDRNMDSWYLMINGYSSKVEGDDDLHLFEKMRDVGVQPNSQTFLYILVAFVSADVVDKLVERLKVVPGDDFLSMEAQKNATSGIWLFFVTFLRGKGMRKKSNTVIFGRGSLLKAVATNIENKIFDLGGLLFSYGQRTLTESSSFDARGE